MAPTLFCLTTVNPATRFPLCLPETKNASTVILACATIMIPNHWVLTEIIKSPVIARVAIGSTTERKRLFAPTRRCALVAIPILLMLAWIPASYETRLTFWRTTRLLWCPFLKCSRMKPGKYSVWKSGMTIWPRFPI